MSEQGFAPAPSEELGADISQRGPASRLAADAAAKPAAAAREGFFNLNVGALHFSAERYDEEAVHLTARSTDREVWMYFSLKTDVAERVARELLAAVEKSRRIAAALSSAEEGA